MSNKTKAEILKKCLGENSIDNQKTRYSVYKAMDKYAEQKQKDIDELLEFIKTAMFEEYNDFIQSEELIQKHTKK